MTNKTIDHKLTLLGDSFQPFLTASNPNVVASLKALGHNDHDIRRIELFDWFQGVGLFGYWELYKLTGSEKYLKILLTYFNDRITDGLPAKNINAMAPMLTLVHLLESGHVPEELMEQYGDIVSTWAQWLYSESPRTEEGGFAHLTCEAANSAELWDDTLFMAVLFLAKAGMYFRRSDYVEEAAYQFLLHNKYLRDRKTGFWFHGYTFDGRHNFVEALWARGNSWITVFVPHFLEIIDGYPLSDALRRTMIQAYNNQVMALTRAQKADGLWPTLLDEPESYSEASASAGFLWGMLKGRSMGIHEEILDDEVIDKGIHAIVHNIDNKGILQQVSGGTAMGKDSLDFYRVIPLVPKPYGQAMAMMALIEFRKENRND